MTTIKSDKDIATLKESGKRLTSVLKRVVDAASPGVSPTELNEMAEKAISDLGDEAAFKGYKPRGAPRPYPAALTVSINDEIVHGIPNEGKRDIRDGDLVSFDIGLKHNGLITDTAYTVGVGEISDEDAKLMQATKEALNAGIDAARAGNTVGDISAAIESSARSGGYAIYRELVGHGVGYEVHEPPHIPNVGKPGTGDELKPGMVIAIEPMIGLGGDKIILLDDGYTYKTADGSRSAHFEHTVVITDNEPLIVTQWE